MNVDERQSSSDEPHAHTTLNTAYQSMTELKTAAPCTAIVEYRVPTGKHGYQRKVYSKYGVLDDNGCSKSDMVNVESRRNL